MIWPRPAPRTLSRRPVSEVPDGAAVTPLTFASRALSATWARDSVPVAVIGLGDAASPVPAATLVTVPDPTGLSQDGSEPLPPVLRYWPATPGASAVQPVTLRLSRLPRSEPRTTSSRAERVTPLGAALPPLRWASRWRVATWARRIVPVAVIGPPLIPSAVSTWVTVPAPRLVRVRLCHLPSLL